MTRNQSNLSATDDLYGPEHIENILNMLGVHIASETGTHFLVLCPFHNNKNTPAMAVDKELGLYFCANGSCDSSGNIDMMITKISGKSGPFQLAIFKDNAKKNIKELRRSAVRKSVNIDDFEVYPEWKVSGWMDNLWENDDAVNYMLGRGITKESLKKYEIGLDGDFITVPMRLTNGNCVGAVRRSYKEKSFKNTFNLPKNYTFWNMQNARKNPVINVTEASFDSILAFQATGIEGAATLSGHISDHLVEQLEFYADEVVIMTDDDDPHQYANCKRCNTIIKTSCLGHNPGEDLGFEIASKVRGPRISWAHSGESTRFGGYKDIGEMPPEFLKQCFDQRISHFEMQRLANR